MNETSTSADTMAGRFSNLRRWNLVMGFFHAIQGIIVLAPSNDFALPVTATFLGDAPGVAPPELSEPFEMLVTWAVAGFLFMSAFAHLIIASHGAFEWYISSLKRMVLQYLKVGRWADLPLRREGVHGSEPHREVAAAWQIFGSTLAAQGVR